MKVMLASIFWIFISLKQVIISAEHHNFTTTEDDEMMMSTSYTTQMYTTEQLVDLTAVGDDFSDDECIFSLILTLDDNEGIEFTLCAYKDDDNELMVGLTFVVPTDRWVAVGFVAASEFDEENEMAGAYSFVIPAHSRSGIHTRYLISNGNIGDKLTRLSALYSDASVDGTRTVKMTRKATVALEDLGEEFATDFSKYYDFSGLQQACNEGALDLMVIYAYAAKADSSFPGTGHGSNADEVTVTTSDIQIDGFSCDELDTASSTSLICATLMVLAALLINY